MVIGSRRTPTPLSAPGSATKVAVILDVVLRQEAVETADSALPVGVVGAQVLEADLVVDAPARPPHGRDHELPRGDLPWHGRTRLDDDSQALVPGDQHVLARRCLAVLTRVELLVRAVDSHSQDLYENSSPLVHVRHRRRR